MLRVYKIDVSSMPQNEFKELYSHVEGYAFLVDTKSDPHTRKPLYIRFFLEENVLIEPLIKKFSGIKYTEITGTDLLKN